MPEVPGTSASIAAIAAATAATISRSRSTLPPGRSADPERHRADRPARRFLAERTTPPNLPLFTPGGDPDAPLVTPGATPRAPLSVRRAAARRRRGAAAPRAAHELDPEPRLALDTADLPMVAGASRGAHRRRIEPATAAAPATAGVRSRPPASARASLPRRSTLPCSAGSNLLVVYFTLKILRSPLRATCCCCRAAPLLAFLALLERRLRRDVRRRRRADDRQDGRRHPRRFRPTRRAALRARHVRARRSSAPPAISSRRCRPASDFAARLRRAGSPRAARPARRHARRQSVTRLAVFLATVAYCGYFPDRARHRRLGRRTGRLPARLVDALAARRSRA